jgi:hypothetical protein
MHFQNVIRFTIFIHDQEYLIKTNKIDYLILLVLSLVYVQNILFKKICIYGKLMAKLRNASCSGNRKIYKFVVVLEIGYRLSSNITLTF